VLIGRYTEEDMVTEAEVLFYFGQAEVQIAATIAAPQGWLIRPLPHLRVVT
jgi:hypothetical protein